jgi:phi LC3 family holin
MKHFLGINRLVRIKNPVFWVQIALALFVPLMTHLGIAWEQVTTWQALGSLILQGLSNPVIVVAMLVSAWNTVNDPTTAGLRDSSLALSYDKPKSEI